MEGYARTEGRAREICGEVRREPPAGKQPFGTRCRIKSGVTPRKGLRGASAPRSRRNESPAYNAGLMKEGGTRSRNSRAQDIEGRGNKTNHGIPRTQDNEEHGEVRAMMREKCTEKSRHSMPGNRRKKTAEYRGNRTRQTAEYRGNRTRQTAEYRGNRTK